MQVPTVTLEDLHAFQAKHFPGAPKAQAPLASAAAVNDNNAFEAEDDDLGYYPDGVKRTLTDEQVKIFRHSEIHKLLRARQLKRDEAEYEARMRGSGEEEGASAKITDEPAHENRDEQGKEGTAELGGRSSAGREPKRRKRNKAGYQTGDMSSEALDYDEQQEGPASQAQTRTQQYSGRRIVSYAEE